jgi:DNA-binding transcriptional ArsR family regulator
MGNGETVEQTTDVEPHKGGRPPGHTNAETAARRREVAALLLRRGAMSGREIAEEVGVSESTASRDLAAIKEAWRAEMVADVDAVVARDLAEMGLVKNEAWRAYQQSLEEGDVIETVTTGGEGGETTTVVTTNAKPDLHALKLVQSCIEKRRRILGLDQETLGGSGPKKISFTVKIGDRILVSEASTADADDVADAEYTEIDSTGKALPSGEGD